MWHSPPRDFASRLAAALAAHPDPPLRCLELPRGSLGDKGDLHTPTAPQNSYCTSEPPWHCKPTYRTSEISLMCQFPHWTSTPFLAPRNSSSKSYPKRSFAPPIVPRSHYGIP